jgi:anti-sigma factor RsiW
MLCKDALLLVEPIAAGDMQLDGDTRSHFETCPGCAGALASARKLESALKAVEVPPAPERFTVGVLQRIRRDRWRSEQQVDWLFNVAIAAAVLLVAAGIAAMLNVDGVMSLASAAWLLVKESARDTMKDAAPTVVTYAAAAGLLASALGMWWWAERRMQY